MTWTRACSDGWRHPLNKFCPQRLTALVSMVSIWFRIAPSYPCFDHHDGMLPRIDTH